MATPRCKMPATRESAGGVVALGYSALLCLYCGDCLSSPLYPPILQSAYIVVALR